MDYDDIVLSILVQCLVPAESSAYLPASCLVVPFLLTTQEIYRGTYIASHIVGHNASDLHQDNEVLHPPEDPLPYTKYLGGREQGFQTSLITHHTL